MNYQRFLILNLYERTYGTEDGSPPFPGVLLFLSMPVYTLIYLDSYSEDPEVLKEFADTFFRIH